MKSLGLAAWHQILFNSINLTLICKALFTIHSVWVLNMCICVLALYICITLYNWYIAFFFKFSLQLCSMRCCFEHVTWIACVPVVLCGLIYESLLVFMAQ